MKIHFVLHLIQCISTVTEALRIFKLYVTCHTYILGMHLWQKYNMFVSVPNVFASLEVWVCKQQPTLKYHLLPVVGVISCEGDQSCHGISLYCNELNVVSGSHWASGGGGRQHDHESLWRTNEQVIVDQSSITFHIVLWLTSLACGDMCY